MAIVRKRFYMVATQGFFAPFNAKVNESAKLNLRGSVEDYLSVLLRKAVDQSGDLRGGSPVLPVSDARVGADLKLTSLSNLLLPAGHADETEDYIFGRGGFLEVADAVKGAPLKLNLGNNQTELVVWGEWELPPGPAPIQWAAVLADITRKPDVLEEVPPPEI